jgi:hypothetical protein
LLYKESERFLKEELRLYVFKKEEEGSKRGVGN